MQRRLLLLGLSALACGAASAQSPGHLNVPGRDMVLASFSPLAGTQSNVHQWLGHMRPDGQVEPMAPDVLHKQTLVLQDIALVVFRPHGPTSVPESGEIYLGDVDAANKGRPLQDQVALVRYTMPAYESRLVLRVSIAAGRAYSGWRQPVVMHYGPAAVQINVKAHGYVVPN